MKAFQGTAGDSTVPSNSNSRYFIINLNWVDILSIFGLILCLFSIGLALSNQFTFAIVFMLLAMLVDMLDGFFARKYNLLRPFGRYLDSSIDVLDYLVVPILILYLWGFNQWYHILALMNFVACGIIRLAVFNEIGNVVNDKGRSCYLGLPVFWIQFVLALFYILAWFIPKSSLFPALTCTLFAYSFLMLYRYYSFKFSGWQMISLLILLLVGLFTLHGFGVLSA